MKQEVKDVVYEFIAPYLPAVWKFIIVCVVVLLAVVADLWSGIRKAKKKGIYTHTYGIDRTLDKLRKRFNLLIAFGLIDTLVIISEVNNSMIPYATVAAGIIMCIVEIKSILEKDEDKGRYIEATKMASEMWKGIDKNELADIIIKKMEENKNEKDSNS